MEGFWPIFFMAVVLKIPIVFLAAIVWWAIRQTPTAEDASDSGGENPHRRPINRPRPRGPHGPAPATLPACPPGGRKRMATPARRPIHR